MKQISRFAQLLGVQKFKEYKADIKMKRTRNIC